MDLLKLLKDVRSNYDERVRVMEHIKLKGDKGFLSVQASYSHCCFPGATVSLINYTSFEVLLSLPFEDIPKKWLDKYRFSCNELFANVPKEEIEELLDVLHKKYGIEGV